MPAFISGTEVMLLEVAGSSPTTNGSNSGTFSTSGGTCAINASSNFNTTINTGSSTGTIGIGNTGAGALTIQSGAASTLQVTGANLTVGTLTSGTLLLTSAGAITASSVGTSSWANSTGGLTISTTTSGTLALTSAGAVAVTSASASTWAATGGLTFSLGSVVTATASAGTYGSTIALVVASNKVTIAGVNGTSATCTLNCAAVAPAGQWLIVETTADSSGTVTVTFGTHFRTTGTQATTLSKISEILFIGDGTNWNEVARNTAMT
jgi:hypothetical protein